MTSQFSQHSHANPFACQRGDEAATPRMAGGSADSALSSESYARAFVQKKEIAVIKSAMTFMRAIAVFIVMSPALSLRSFGVRQ